MLINQKFSGDGSRGLFTQASPNALLSKVAEVIGEHGRRWQRDRYYWRTDGHPPSLNAPEAFTTNNYTHASEQAPGLRAFVRMTWSPQPERPEYPECFFLVDFEQIPVFTESQWIESRSRPIPGPEEEEWLRILKQVTVRIHLGGLPQRRRDKPLSTKDWPAAWGAQPMKKAEQQRLHADSEAEDLLAALDALSKAVWTAYALANQGLLDVASLSALPTDIETAMAEPGIWSEEMAAYQAIVKQRLANCDAPMSRPLWINPHKQAPDDIRIQLLLILLQEGMISDDSTRHELELWAVDYLRRYFRRLSDNTAYEVFFRLQREFVYPEDWRVFLKYTGKVVRGVLAENRDQKYRRHVGKQRNDRDMDNFSVEMVPEDSSPPVEPLQLYTAKQALRYLQEKDLQVDRSTLYRWMNGAKVQSRLVKGQQKITQKELDRVAAVEMSRVQQKKLRKVLKEVVAEKRGIKEDSAKTHIRRALRRGKTLKDIAKASIDSQEGEGPEEGDISTAE